jgi:hypothetical protein
LRRRQKTGLADHPESQKEMRKDRFRFQKGQIKILGKVHGQQRRKNGQQCDAEAFGPELREAAGKPIPPSSATPSGKATAPRCMGSMGQACQ